MDLKVLVFTVLGDVYFVVNGKESFGTEDKYCGTTATASADDGY